MTVTSNRPISLAEQQRLQVQQGSLDALARIELPYEKLKVAIIFGYQDGILSVDLQIGCEPNCRIYSFRENELLVTPHLGVSKKYHWAKDHLCENLLSPIEESYLVDIFLDNRKLIENSVHTQVSSGKFSEHDSIKIQEILEFASSRKLTSRPLQLVID